MTAFRVILGLCIFLLGMTECFLENRLESHRMANVNKRDVFPFQELKMDGHDEIEYLYNSAMKNIEHAATDEDRAAILARAIKELGVVSDIQVLRAMIPNHLQNLKHHFTPNEHPYQ